MIREYADALKKLEELSPVQNKMESEHRKLKITPKAAKDEQNAVCYNPRIVEFQACYEMIQVDNGQGGDCKYDKVVALTE